MISKAFHDQVYEVFTWSEIGNYSFELGKKIVESGIKFDRIVALARGGVSIAQSLSDLVAIKRISVIQSELYSGIGKKSERPIIVQPLAANIRSERILLIDDLADSGETLAFARSYLESHGPSTVHTATLAIKPWSTLKPDFWQIQSEAWLIFPWETRETITTLRGMWAQKGDTLEAIREKLAGLGYGKDQIETFSQS